MQLEVTVRMLKQIAYYILSESMIKDLCDVATGNLTNAIETKTKGQTKAPLENGKTTLKLSEIPKVLTQIKIYLALCDHFSTS